MHFSRMCAITEPELWSSSRPDPMDVAKAMPASSPRVLKTHLSFDMLPSEVMEKRNKVQYDNRYISGHVLQKICQHSRSSMLPGTQGTASSPTSTTSEQ